MLQIECDGFRSGHFYHFVRKFQAEIRSDTREPHFGVEGQINILTYQLLSRLTASISQQYCNNLKSVDSNLIIWRMSQF